MTDLSIDSTIMTMAEKLYGWSSEDHIDLIIQRDISHDPIHCYCFIILTPGTLNGFLQIEDWKIRTVLCAGSGDTIEDAKRDILNRLLEKAQNALEVPVEKVMNS